MKVIKGADKLEHNKASHKTNHLKDCPFGVQFALNIRSLSIVPLLLKGTDSNEWLLLAEDKVYKKLKSK